MYKLVLEYRRHHRNSPATLHVALLYLYYVNDWMADINECEQGNDCHQLCQNTEGSFLCSCNEGFTLTGDRKNCTG